ncbi:MAG: AAA family ATPase [Clostridiales bacterium]|nr:AAA family ATPase [Clostridiales bacterium]
MKDNIVKKALNKILERKLAAERKYETQTKSLYSNPNFVNLEKEYTRTMIENARKESLGETVDKSLEHKLHQQIKEYKNSINVGEVEYSCPLCKDTGYLNGDRCKCLNQEISRLLLENSGFDELEDFEKAQFSDNTTKAFYKKMQQWCDSSFSKNLILIAGEVGVGKTHLAKCMAKTLIEKGKVVKIVTALNLNQDMKEFSKRNDETILNNYLDIEILFIDDLGTEPLYKNVTEQFLYLIINERKMKKLPTIITTNLDLDDIRNRYDERIYSRIGDKKTSINYFLSGQDFRLKNRK